MDYEYTFTDHGSLWLVTPNTDEAEAHLKANTGDECQWSGTSLAVEPRYVASLAVALQSDGFSVGGN